ncbi:hypothetical protein KIN20_024220 [Parelaphostrongylus tenuis]|uniref:ABC transmembrane type-1 domain-containing protein n=1 Tax=Parelaphostrongylus tenuis TaxID=148309 RepID=A0AAD5NAV1_PARTN|nr:hypothetical protein KIN20_024220 [Parelaphostrongylus tenuis]
MESCVYFWVASNVWLARWSDDAETIQQSSNDSSYETNMRLAIYTSLGMGQAVFVCVASTIMALGMVGASRLLHEGILRNILHCPMLFFDITPIGRILNRFGKDTEVVDNELLKSVGQWFFTVGQIVITTVLLLYVTPWAFGPVIAILCINMVVLVNIHF